ncbi:hypothetical protein SHKM778_37060 [Streptomyces sp. KM77-8]|uniref:Uncharacterized protein n=1 Tax=Streptomyces haneummycinicus TaxID=3074435 RepID=A0AAT9HIS8_9ACTN
MTGGLEVPGSVPTTALPAVVARVTALADRLGVAHTEVFHTGRLSAASGVLECVVKALLGGRLAGNPMCRRGSCSGSTCCAVPG